MGWRRRRNANVKAWDDLRADIRQRMDMIEENVRDGAEKEVTAWQLRKYETVATKTFQEEMAQMIDKIVKEEVALATKELRVRIGVLEDLVEEMYDEDDD